MNDIPNKLKAVMLKLKILIDALYFQFVVSTFQFVRNVVFQRTRSTNVQLQPDLMRTSGLDQMRVMNQRRITKSFRDAHIRTSTCFYSLCSLGLCGEKISGTRSFPRSLATLLLRDFALKNSRDAHFDSADAVVDDGIR